MSINVTYMSKLSIKRAINIDRKQSCQFKKEA